MMAVAKTVSCVKRLVQQAPFHRIGSYFMRKSASHSITRKTVKFRFQTGLSPSGITASLVASNVKPLALKTNHI